MQLSSQLVQRCADRFHSYERLLAFGAPDASVLTNIKAHAAASYDYKHYQQSLNHIDNAFFGLPTSDAQYDALLVFVPKAKEELKFTLAALTPLLEKGGDIFLVGEKKGGVASAAKQLASLGEDASKIDAAKHSQLWHVTLEQAVKPFVLSDWFEDYTIKIAETDLILSCLPGVFSYGRLDEGTALLLEHLPKKLRGRVLDFACGNGVIGLVAKQRWPEIELEQVDVSWLALECARRGAQLNGLETKVYASDGWSEVQGRVNAVLTNPPFHEGVKTAYDTTENFIAQSPQKLSKSAPVFLVANNFLRYPALIEKSLGSCKVVAENARFRVYSAYR